MIYKKAVFELCKNFFALKRELLISVILNTKWICAFEEQPQTMGYGIKVKGRRTENISCPSKIF